MRRLLAILQLIVLCAAVVGQGGMGPGPGVKSYSSGETNFVNDTFTEGSDVNLTAHTPELGGSWVDHTDGAYTNPVSILASTDVAYSSSGAAAGMYYNDATPPSADYCAEGVITVASIISANSSIAVRADTSANTMYVFRLNNGTSWDVRRIVTGTQTTLPAATSDTSNLPGVGESRTMKLCVSGGATPTLAAYVDGVHLSTLGGLDGSPITATGKAGIRFSGTFTSTTGYQFSSFRAFTP